MPEVDAFIGTNQINDITTVCDERVNTRSLPVIPHRQSERDLSLRRVHAARARHAGLLRLCQDRRRLRPPVRLLLHPADARPLSQPPLRLGHKRSAGARRARRERVDPRRAGFFALRRRSRISPTRSRICYASCARLDGIEWVRVMYTYPTHISDRIPRRDRQRTEGGQVSRHALAARIAKCLEADAARRQSRESRTPDRACPRACARHRRPHDFHHGLSRRDGCRTSTSC